MDAIKFYKLVHEINDLHKETSIIFFQKYEKIYNLKKEVRKLFDTDTSMFQGDFLLHLDNYHESLNLALIYNDLEFEYSSWDLRSRIKQKDSIINKLIHYQTKKIDSGPSNGSFALKKCLNDLYGFRVVINELDHKSVEFKDMLEALKVDCQLMKCYYRDDQGYKGTHLYFNNKDNFYFPWELQVWSKQDAINNEVSHREHKLKRSYTAWPSEFVEEVKLKKGR